MSHKPFIYLSAGVSNPVFIGTLELAGESGKLPVQVRDQFPHVAAASSYPFFAIGEFSQQ